MKALSVSLSLPRLSLFSIEREGRGFFQRLSKVCFCLVVAFIGLSLAGTLFYAWFPVPLTPLMVIRAVENLVDGKPVVFAKDWVPIEEMSARLQQAVVAAEDMKFFEHDGFDFEAIEKALQYNRRRSNKKDSGRGRIRGGSTISQQVAKNVFLWPNRSWLRKALETYFTLLIETTWSKERIMEVYLNVIELGDGVYGVEAASRRYFQKSARTLSASEAALIAAVLPNPRRFLIRRPSTYVRFRQTLIQRRMPWAALMIPQRH